MTMTEGTRRLIAAVLFLMTVILAAGFWFYREQHVFVLRDVEEELEAIASLKVDEIASWRAERIGDANVLLHSPRFMESATSYLRDPNPSTADELRARFEALCEHYGYSDVLLVRDTGEICLSQSGAEGFIDRAALPILADALNAGSVQIVDLHDKGALDGTHLSVIAPIQKEGAVLLVCDAERYLFPFIGHWPTPSKTAETLLVRREGDDVVFLNDLRHQPGMALQLRIPMTRSDVPATLAVRGETGVVFGTDYRGVEVVAALRAISDSPWYMVSKVDADEVFATWRFRAAAILGLIIAGLLFVAAFAFVVWQRNEVVRYAALLNEEKARKESEERNRVTLMSVGDGVIVTDTEGRVELMNPVAETLTGWASGESAGRPLEEVFRIVNEESREKVENPVRRVVREGLVVGLANHTLLISRDGTERAIADSGAPIRDPAGALIGVVLVFRDQTTERMAERAVETERNNMAAIMAASPVGLLVLDETECITDANPAAERLLGRKLEQLKNRRCGDFIACPHRHDDPEGCGHTPECPTCPLLSAIRDSLATGRGVLDREAEVAAERKGGSSRWLRFSVEPVTLSGKRHVVMALDDITASKQAAEEVDRLLKQGDKDRAALLSMLEDVKDAEEQMSKQVGELQRWNDVTLGREERILELKQEVNELAERLGEEPRYGGGIG